MVTCYRQRNQSTILAEIGEQEHTEKIFQTRYHCWVNNNSFATTKYVRQTSTSSKNATWIYETFKQPP